MAAVVQVYYYAGFESLPLHCVIKDAFIQLFLSIYMFINIPCRTSDCVERMVVDPLRGVVQVAYAKGNIYEYDCVSRRAILNLLMNPNMSLGFWVNTNLLPFDCKTRVLGSCTPLRGLSASEMPITA